MNRRQFIKTAIIGSAAVTLPIKAKAITGIEHETKKRERNPGTIQTSPKDILYATNAMRKELTKPNLVYDSSKGPARNLNGHYLSESEYN